MFRNHTHHLAQLVKGAVIFMLVAEITGLGVLRSGDGGCEPACSMHRPKQPHQACCTVFEPAHSMTVVGGEQKNRQTPSPCCDGTLCTDSALKLPEEALQANHFPPVLEVPSQIQVRSTNVPSRSLKKPFFQWHYLKKEIPIYILTCIYLI